MRHEARVRCATANLSCLMAHAHALTMRPMAILRTCVFPCAGFGTRFFPATKVIPKEMLPLVDKPILQYGIEEARDSGFDKLVIVTSKGKEAIFDHFDGTAELERSK